MERSSATLRSYVCVALLRREAEASWMSRTRTQHGKHDRDRRGTRPPSLAERFVDDSKVQPACGVPKLCSRRRSARFAGRNRVSASHRVDNQKPRSQEKRPFESWAEIDAVAEASHRPAPGKCRRYEDVDRDSWQACDEAVVTNGQQS